MTPTRPSWFRSLARTTGIGFVTWLVVAGLASHFIPNVPVGNLRTGAAEGYVVGALHMHTLASDGGGTVDDLVDAAQANGLDFIVVSDHDTREPTRFEYRNGTLVVLGEELSTIAGHALLLGVDSVRVAAPDSLDRLHGLPVHRSINDATLRIVAHPNGRRFWRDRTLRNVQGMEIWNADSEWRNDGLLDWLEALTLLPFRPALAMLALVDRPDRNLALLDSVTVAPPSPAVPYGLLTTTCAVDAHARIDITDRIFIPFPSYRTSLGLVQQHLPLATPFTGRAEEDGPILLEAIRRGGGYCAIGGLADDGSVRIAVADGHVRVSVPPDVPRARIRIYRDGEVLAEAEAHELDAPATAAAVYRVEIDARARLLRPRWFPWILSGPFRVVS